jgi:hypothetical protein
MRGETQGIQRGTSLHSLWQEASVKKGGRLLGIGEELRLSPSQLKIFQEHLMKLCGVFSRIRDVAAGKVISNKLNTIITHPAVTNYWTPLNDTDDSHSNNCQTKRDEQTYSQA